MFQAAVPACCSSLITIHGRDLRLILSYDDQITVTSRVALIDWMSNQVSVIHHQIADVQNTNPLSIKNHFDTCWRKIFHLSEKQRRALLYKELFLLCFQYMLRLSAPPSPPGRELESTLFLRQVKVESWPNIAGGRKPGVCPYRHG